MNSGNNIIFSLMKVFLRIFFFFKVHDNKLSLNLWEGKSSCGAFLLRVSSGGKPGDTTGNFVLYLISSRV